MEWYLSSQQICSLLGRVRQMLPLALTTQQTTINAQNISWGTSVKMHTNMFSPRTYITVISYSILCVLNAFTAGCLSKACKLNRLEWAWAFLLYWFRKGLVIFICVLMQCFSS